PGNRTGRLEPGWRDAAAIRSMRRRSIRAFRSGRAIRAVSATGSAIEVIAPESSGQRRVDLDLAPGQAIKRAVFYSLNEAPFVRAVGFSSGGLWSWSHHGLSANPGHQ